MTYAMNVGGMESVTLSLARGLRDAGHQVSFVVTGSIGPWHERPAAEGFDTEAVLLSLLESRQNHVKRVAKVLSGFDVVLLNHSTPAQCAAGLLPDATVVLAILHNDVEEIYRVGLANFENLDGVVAVGQKVLNEAQLRRGRNDVVVLIRNGVNVLQQYPKSVQDLDAARPLRIVFLGRVSHEQKGVLMLPGILSHLKQRGIAAELEVIGDGPDMAQLRAALSEISAPNATRILGAVDHTSAMERLGQSDILLMPSFYEGQPITLFEAMARGVVPVASFLPGITDSVIDEGIDGYLAPVGDAAAFADALVKLKEPAVRTQVSRAAWEKATEQFGVDVMAGSYIHLITQCRQSRAAGARPARTRRLDASLLGKRSAIPFILHEAARLIKQGKK